MPHDEEKPRPHGAKNDGKSRHKEDGSPADLSRRKFIRGASIAGAAISAGTLLGDRVLEAATLPKSAEASADAGGVVGPGEVPITLKINGKTQQLNLEPRVTLLDALRNHLDMTGAKKVCDRGTCGACTVHLDGHAVYSCSTLAIDAQGHEITTIEGLEPAEGLHPMSRAFWDNDAQQCGFCTPGFVMACSAYVDHEPNPTYEGLQKALGGNLCRCGTYMGIRQAVLDAAKSMKGGRA
ncbi:MAG TPA: (2Fe-2S)-binding protein [Candidatus Acidoferrales bacterium]|nr:(2Fe-2S)-binding protein [Candidatus Acidoferrales bacterium]HEV2340502.1 (2Fe-2S)-binding protein [Candidatus Acidoferrales bacterium]